MKNKWMEHARVSLGNAKSADVTKVDSSQRKVKAVDFAPRSRKVKAEAFGGECKAFQLLQNLTSGSDLATYGKRLGIKIDGIFAKDQLYEKIKNKTLPEGDYIVNIGTLESGGTHWCAFRYTPNDCFWSCSFGGYPLQLVEDLTENQKLYFNKSQYQDSEAVSCGFYALACLKALQNRKSSSPVESFKKYINQFHKKKLLDNDKILFDFVFS